MNKKLLLVYLLFFISINAMAAIASVDCKSAANGISSNNLQKHQLQCSNPSLATEDDTQQADKVRDDNFTNLQFSNREQSGSLTFILLIPALLVFVFSGFEKSNK